jgi:hypothetical protein
MAPKLQWSVPTPLLIGIQMNLIMQLMEEPVVLLGTTRTINGMTRVVVTHTGQSVEKYLQQQPNILSRTRMQDYQKFLVATTVQIW